MIDFRKNDFDAWWNIWGPITDGPETEMKNIAWQAWQAACLPGERSMWQGDIVEDYPNVPEDITWREEE